MSAVADRHTHRADQDRRGLAGRTTWLAGLVVALGAVGSTAHGLYVVAQAAGVPQAIAWLYPLITDGLALVAYACTAQLVGPGRRYAWTVVVIAAGLSGLAQASYLAGGVPSAPPGLRFGVGAWPAIAAAVVAHLLFLLSTRERPAVQPSPVQPSNGTVPVAALNGAVQRLVQDSRRSARSPKTTRSATPARDRASAAAHEHLARHGGYPTVTQLAELAAVARGTAGAVLQNLRRHPTAEAITTEPRQQP